MSNNFADILIVCGQGVYRDGFFHCEYDDRDVYLGHGVEAKNVFAKFKYTHLVCSGGFTRFEAPDCSEAAGFIRMWADTGAAPSVDPIFDEISLDSGENLFFGLMAARRRLDNIPFRRVGAFSAWAFKKARFNLVARTLGIVDRFYFHGFAGAAETGVEVPTTEFRKPSKNEYDEDTDDRYLLLATKWEEKRRRRWQRNPEELVRAGAASYERRLSALEAEFPSVMDARRKLESAVRGGSTADCRHHADLLRAEFLRHVMLA